jgi:hypothetical protein
MVPNSESGSGLPNRSAAGTKSSRLAAQRFLNAAHRDLTNRLRRPPLRLGNRYRDLTLITWLIHLELDHLAESDSEDGEPWSDHWGGRLHLELHSALARYSAKRRSVGRWLPRETRAAAESAAAQQYQAIARAAPGRVQQRLPAIRPRGASAAERLRRRVFALRERARALSRGALASTPAVPAIGPRFRALTRRARALGASHRPGRRELVVAGIAGALVLVVLVDEPDAPAVDGVDWPELEEGLRSAAQVAPPLPPPRPETSAESSSRAGHASRVSRPATGQGRRSRDQGHSRQAHSPDESVPTPAPVRAPTPAAPDPVVPVPTTAPAPEPPAPQPEPVAESPPEFGFER